MDLLQLMEERYSLRAYDARPVEEEKLQRVLEAGRIAPTAKNMQPWKVYVVEKEKDLALLRSLTPCAFDAPVVLMFCGIEAESAHSGFDGHSWDQMDTTIVMTHMMLEAQAQGLGTCIVGWFDSEAVQIVARYAAKIAPELRSFLLPVEPLLTGIGAQLPGLTAACGLQIVRASLFMLNEMKTFDEANVSTASDGPGAKRQHR